MIKVGVTGSNGFIGWHLCHTLKLYTNKFELIEFKRDWFKENTKLDSFVLKCDIIVHLGGLNRHNEDSIIHDTNTGLALTLVESFKRTDFKGQLMFSSSIHEDKNNIFGNSKKVARELFAKGKFIEVWVNTPTELCAQRDPKGLYKKAAKGEIPNFTGVGQDYERPANPEIKIDGTADLESSVSAILKVIL